MNILRHRALYGLLGALAFLSQTSAAWPQSAQLAAEKAKQPAAAATRDGQHDFDFKFGTWKTCISRLQDPLTGSATWIKMNGTVVVRKIWGGRASFEETEVEGPAGHWEGLTLFLYNPQSHHWSQVFANSPDGTLSRPGTGEFKDGRGEFLDQESFKGRTILVRVVWSDITPTSHRFEQALSGDGGKTWEPNFIATLTREEQSS